MTDSIEARLQVHEVDVKARIKALEDQIRMMNTVMVKRDTIDKIVHAAQGFEAQVVKVQSDVQVVGSQVTQQGSQGTSS